MQRISKVGIINSAACHYMGTFKHFFRKFLQKTKQSQKLLSHTSLKQLLQNCKSVESQFEVFNSFTKLTEEDISLRYAICRDIEKIFQPHFPSSSVHPTGSTVSRLGLRSSDLDLSFQHSSDLSNQCAPANEADSDLTLSS
ncbi:speckle targeted PIP5K1A-regulated poly(A) polymerase [Caerostris extrusa]|uniref:Speckle targeted PIP5K1A-regulated poly(A) polymerase n=1 Tax=Caerostris extrusa TaxID=172846 RepID=A0AAV4X019_CAEEX|nr:speckle targeted PIP5K1A-regulated poly(A) polymerase [Caerostris extrusa]